jgi:regulator of cell morphogenesis and NO signaling
MTLTASETVGEVVADNPSSARVFEKYGIDYCCGGNRPLAEVCAEKGLNVEEFSRELADSNAPAQERDWRNASLADLADHIVGKHHAYLRSELPEIERKIQKVLEAHWNRHGVTISALREVFVALKTELTEHMVKEERILFPMIQRMEAKSNVAMPTGASVNQPIRVMEHEHATAGQALAEMRRLTSEYTAPEDACNTFRVLYRQLEELESDLHLHIHLENNILFPRAAALEQSLRG